MGKYKWDGKAGSSINCKTSSRPHVPFDQDLAKKFLVKLDIGREDVYCTHARIQVQHTALAA